MEIPNILARVVDELEKSELEHEPIHSAHEGWAVILEEVVEMGEAIHAKNLAKATNEAYQVAAMAIRFLKDLDV